MIEFLGKAFDSVGEFHQMIGAEVSDGTGEAHELDSLTEALRLSLMNEELTETKDAICAFDKVETVDGLCDSLVVSLGTLHSLNVSKEELFEGVRPTIDLLIEGGASGLCNKILISNLFSIKEDDVESLVGALLGAFISYDVLYPEFNLQENFFIVHENNMSKSYLDETLAHSDVESYKLEGVNCDVFLVEGSSPPRYIIRREDGKLLKSKSWVPPVLILK